MSGGRSRGGGRARLRLWIAVAGATATALIFAASASAASATVTGCSEIPAGYAITFSGSGFAANSSVLVYDNGVLRGATTTDRRGEFNDLSVLILSLPSEVSFVDAAGNTATVLVTTCGGGGGGDGGGGGGDEAPVTKDECKKGGHLDFTDPVFKNQGQCVSTVASKNK